MKLLTGAYFRQVLQEYEAQEGRLPTEVAACYLLASDALCQYLSPKWVFEKVFDVAPLAAFLRAQPETPPDAFKHGDRVISLAQMLFNFQQVDGIEGRVKQLRHANVETIAAELEGAKLLYRSSRAFRFVTESGERGSDFDIAVTLSDGSLAGCESKCKVEATRPSVGSLFDTLEHAVGQIRPGIPIVLFVKIPESWPRDPTIQAVVGEALAKATALSSPPGLVVFHWEEWMALETGGMARVVRYRPELNAGARSFHADFSHLITPTGPWRYLLEIVRELRKA